jgi:hypothetical protein
VRTRVQAIAAPFVARQRWLMAFFILGGVYILDDLIHLSVWGLVFDAFVALALWSLWRAVAQFQVAARTGDLVALARAMKELQGYIKVTVIVGFVTLGLLVVLGVIAIEMAMSGALTSAALKGALHG